MQPFWEIVASNALLVVVLAAGAALLGRVWKNPLCLHLLWVFVLLKLMTPPLVTVPIASLTKPIARTSRVDASRPEPVFTTAAEERRSPLHDFVISESSHSDRNIATIADGLQRMPWFLIFGWGWGVGIVAFASSQAYRIVHFQNLLRSGRTPSSTLLDMAEETSKQLGLKRIPEIRLLPVCVSPLVWSLGGRPRVFLPSALFEQLDGAAQRAILAHELAHVRRGDHWIRLLEMVFTALFWWHPIVWLAARQLQKLEDQCCDAMVVDLAPRSAKSYAVALLDTLDFLCDRPSIAAPLGAMAANPSVSLTRRIEMLKNRSWTTRWTLGRLMLVLTVTALPMALAFGQEPPESYETPYSDSHPLLAPPTPGPPPQAPERSFKQAATGFNKKAAEDAIDRSQPSDSPRTSEFPYSIEFEQGATLELPLEPDPC